MSDPLQDKPPKNDPPSSDMPKVKASYGTENASIDAAFRAVDKPQPPKAKTGKRLTVCAAAEIPVGGRRIVKDGSLQIGVFNVGGKFFAVKNVCPHMGAPLCSGTIHATHRPSDVHEYDPALAGRVLRCPWHGWEFDIITGKGLFDAKSKVATYLVEVDEAGDVVVVL